MQAGRSFDLFFRGDHKEIVRRYHDTPKGGGPGDMAFIVGSLAFIGRLEEAEVVFDNEEPNLDPEARCFSLFFLAITHNRNGQQAGFFHRLNQIRRIHGSFSGGAFYWMQAIAFFHFNGSRFKVAERLAKRAYLEATVQQNFYGRALALDLHGHALVAIGDVEAGIASMRRAKQFFEQLGNGSYVRVMDKAISNYQVLYTPHLLSSDEKLGFPANVVALTQNNYTDVFQLLTAVRALCLSGRLDEAHVYLEKAQTIVESEAHKRCEPVVSFRKAMLEWSSGKTEYAKQILSELELNLDKFDYKFQAQILGFLHKISSSCGQDTDQSRLLRLKKITAISQYGLAKRILRRQGHCLSDITLGKDPLGDIIDQIHSQSTPLEEKFALIIKHSLFGMLYEVLELDRSEIVIYVNPLPNSLFIFDRGNVTFVEQHVSQNLVSKCLQIFSETTCLSKAELVDILWGYSYHPTRHDPLVYNLMTRVRTVLGDNSGTWIEAKGGGYQVSPMIRILCHSWSPQISVSDEPLTKSHHDLSELNQRQVKIIQYLNRFESLTAKDCSDLFEGVSRVTVSRDLKGLSTERYLLRHGRGKATYYTLNQERLSQ